jgi:glycosyltransferase involved in cell wall biosynthesis
MYPKISVITPSFRGAALIESTIQSVLSQGYPSLEYIVIDGAGDDTADLLRRYVSWPSGAASRIAASMTL